MTNSGCGPDPAAPPNLREARTYMHGETRGQRVLYVDEGALPEGIDWAFIETDDLLVLAVKREHWSPELMAEAWQEYAAAN